MARDNETSDRRIGRRAILKLGAAFLLGAPVLSTSCQQAAPAPTAKPAAPSQPAGGAAPTAAQAATNAASIKIGSVHPLTGSVAFEGNQVAKGCRLRLEEANNAGGIKSMGGAKIEILEADTQAKPEVGVAETERLIGQGVLAILGAFQSAVTIATTQSAEKAKVPHVVSVAVSDDITKRGFKYTFRQQPNSEAMAKLTVVGLKDLIDRKKATVKTIAVIHEDSLMGDTMGRYLETAIKDNGYQMVDNIPYKATTSDLTTEVSRLKSLKPDVLINNGYIPDTLLLVRTIRDLKVDFMGILGSAASLNSNPVFVKEEPKLAEYVMDGNYWWNPKNPRSQQVRDAFQKRFGEEMTSHAIVGYQSTDVLVDALERAGKPDREAIREALVKTKLGNLVMPGETIEFDERGENKNATPVLLQFQKGVSQVIAPGKYADAEEIFPIPPLAERLK